MSLRSYSNKGGKETKLDKKLIGDIAEQAVIFNALKQGFGVLRPIGDRHKYDLVLDTGPKLVKVQVKSAWKDGRYSTWIVNVKKTNTNRRNIKIWNYLPTDFDFVCAYVRETEDIYMIPSEVFCSYQSSLTLSDKFNEYRNNWTLFVE